MTQAEAEIIRYRKAEEMAKAFRLRAWENKLEFSVDSEKLLRDFLKNNLSIVKTEFKEKIIDSYQDKDFLRSYSNRVMSKTMGDFAQTEPGEYVKTEYDISGSENSYHARKYFMVCKL